MVSLTLVVSRGDGVHGRRIDEFSPCRDYDKTESECEWKQKLPRRISRGCFHTLIARLLPIAIRWLLAEQMMHEEIECASLGNRAGSAVVRARHNQQIEILSGLDQRIHETHRGFGRNVVIHFPDDQEQFSIQLC